MSLGLSSCRITTQGGVTVVTLLAEFNYQMGLEVIQYLSDNNLYQHRIIDYNGFSWHVARTDMLRMTEFSKAVFPAKNYVAFTADDDLAYGTLRELSVYRQQDGLSEVAVFRTLEESIAWMNERRPAEPIH